MFLSLVDNTETFTGVVVLYIQFQMAQKKGICQREGEGILNKFKKLRIAGQWWGFGQIISIYLEFFLTVGLVRLFSEQRFCCASLLPELCSTNSAYSYGWYL